MRKKLIGLVLALIITLNFGMVVHADPGTGWELQPAMSSFVLECLVEKL